MNTATRPLRALWRRHGAGNDRPQPSRAASACAGWFFFIAQLIAPQPAVQAQPAPPPSWLVVERAGQRITVRQSPALTVTHTIEAPAPVTGTPLYSASQHAMYVATATGSLAAYDLRGHQWVAQVDLGAPVTRLALSGDGQWLAAATTSPPALHLLDSALNVHARHASATLDGKTVSHITSIEDAPQRQSFIIGQADIPELWEVSYDRQAKPIYDGLVHDFRMGESIAKPGFLGVRRTPLDAPLDLRAYGPAHRHVVGSSRGPHGDTPPTLQIIHLDIRRRIVQMPATAAPGTHIRSSALLAVPLPATAQVAGVNPVTWRVEGIMAGQAWNGVVPAHSLSTHWWLVAPGGLAITVYDSASLHRRATLPLPCQAQAMAFASSDEQVAVITAGTPGAVQLYDSRTFEKLGTQTLDQPTAVIALPSAASKHRQ